MTEIHDLAAGARFGPRPTLRAASVTASLGRWGRFTLRFAATATGATRRGAFPASCARFPGRRAPTARRGVVTGSILLRLERRFFGTIRIRARHVRARITAYETPCMPSLFFDLFATSPPAPTGPWSVRILGDPRGPPAPDAWASLDGHGRMREAITQSHDDDRRVGPHEVRSVTQRRTLEETGAGSALSLAHDLASGRLRALAPAFRGGFRFTPLAAAMHDGPDFAVRRARARFAHRSLHHRLGAHPGAPLRPAARLGRQGACTGSPVSAGPRGALSRCPP